MTANGMRVESLTADEARLLDLLRDLNTVRYWLQVHDPAAPANGRGATNGCVPLAGAEREVFGIARFEVQGAASAQRCLPFSDAVAARRDRARRIMAPAPADRYGNYDGVPRLSHGRGNAEPRSAAMVLARRNRNGAA